MVDLVTKVLAQGNFEGLAESRFVPSIDQIHDLYRTWGHRAQLRRVLRNFAERNRDVAIDRVALYRGLAEIMLRHQAKAVLRRLGVLQR